MDFTQKKQATKLQVSVIILKWSKDLIKTFTFPKTFKTLINKKITFSGSKWKLH